MKPDTHLGENTRQIEVSDDQTTSFFSAEFKREAAALVLDQGYSHIEACRSLGVVESALRRCVNQLQQKRSGVTPQTKALTPEQQKIQELEARIARLEREKSILKKATALLMSEEHERTR
ncbi:Transposase [Pseudomonas cichorii]|nr:Transposase [Pseudomonas cichorii]